MAVTKLPPVPTKPAKQTDLQVTSVERSELFAAQGFARYNPDLLAGRKGGLRIYRKMLDDEQVKAVVDFKSSSIIGRGWEFVFDESTDLDSEERDERVCVMNAMLHNMRGSFTDALRAVLKGTVYGYSLCEKVTDTFEYEGKTWSGITAILPRIIDTETFLFYTNEFGVLDRFIQRIGGKEIELDYRRFVHYVRSPEEDPWYGESDLKAAYRSWFMKDTMIKFWAQFLERMAGGFASISLNDSGITPSSPDYASLQQMVSNLRGTMGVILPRGVTMEMVTPSTTDAYQKAVEFHDLSIAKALLIPNLLGLSNSGQTGAYAQSQTQLEVYLMTIAADTARLEQVLNDQVFKDVGLNNWADGLYPRFKFKHATPEQLRWTVTTWQSLVGANVVVPTEEDEAHLRKLLDMPSRDEDTAPLVTPAQEQAQLDAAHSKDLAVKGQDHQQSMDQQQIDIASKKVANDKAKFTQDRGRSRAEVADIIAAALAKFAHSTNFEAVYDESQHPRDEHGRWTSGGGGGSGSSINRDTLTGTVSKTAGFEKLTNANKHLLLTKYEQAAEAHDQFINDLNTLADGAGLGVMLPPKDDTYGTLKGAERAIAKITNDYAGDPSKIKDLLRATLVVSSPEAAIQAEAAIRSRFTVNELASKNSLDPSFVTIDGYRDAKWIVRTSNGTVAEIQVNVPKMLELKNNGGHDLYKQKEALLRSIPMDRFWTEAEISSYADLNRRSREFYAPADPFSSSLNSAKDTSQPIRMADSRLNGRGGSVSQAQQPGPGEFFPAYAKDTGMPSTLKKGVPAGSSSTTSRNITTPPAKSITQRDDNGNGRDPAGKSP